MANLNPRVYRLQRVGWIYVVNRYALLHTKNKNYWLHGFQRFLKFFPIIRQIIRDPQGMAKLDPKGTVGTIYAGNHKIVLYTNFTIGLIDKILIISL